MYFVIGKKNCIVILFQYLAMLTYDMVSPGPSVCSTSRKKNRIQKRSKQPNDLREGMTNAYIVLRQVSGYKLFVNV